MSVVWSSGVQLFRGVLEYRIEWRTVGALISKCMSVVEQMSTAEGCPLSRVPLYAQSTKFPNF